MPKIDRETKALDNANSVRQTEGSAVVQGSQTTSARGASSTGKGHSQQDQYERPKKKEVTSLEEFEARFSQIDLTDMLRDLDFDRGVQQFERKFEDEGEEKARERKIAERKKKDVARVGMPRSRVPVITLSPLHHVVVPSPVGQGGPNLPTPNLPTTSPMMFPMWAGESIEALQARATAYEGMIRDQASSAQGYAKSVEDLSRAERKRQLRLEEERRLERRAAGEDWVDDAGDRRRDFESSMDKNAEYAREQDLMHEQLLEEQRARDMSYSQSMSERMAEEQRERDRMERERQAERLAQEQRDRDRYRYDD